MADDHLFGLTPEARYYIDQSAAAAAKKTVDELTTRGCPFVCKDMEAVKTVVFGKTEDNIIGLDQQIDENAAAIASLKRFGWVLITACVSALALGVAEVIVSLVTHH